MSGLITYERFEQCVRRIAIKNFQIRLEVEPEFRGFSDIPKAPVLVIVLNVPDWDTGAMTVFKTKRSFVFCPDLDEEQLYRSIVHGVLGVLSHELQECFLVDGLRMFDPHAQEGR